MAFTKEDIKINPSEETEKIVQKLKDDVRGKLKKRGAVVGISGGIDSSLVLALCAKAFGANKVLGVMMPEQDSNPDSLTLAKELANKFDVQYVVEDMTDAVRGFGCYT
ncbi:MAG: hypothetical protein K8R79_06475 [Calditrichales bacterium]|nr:hypothetical protein [Calditrichales bacterium]